MTKQVNELGFESAVALSEHHEINTEKLTGEERIKAFCKVSYQLYLNHIAEKMPDANIRKLQAEPPDQFTNAA